MKNVAGFLAFVAICSALIVGCRLAGDVHRRALMQMELEQCLDKPWLDTSHGC